MIHKNVKIKKFSSDFRGEHLYLKCERTAALCVKLNTWACRGIAQTNIWSEWLMSERRKSGVFLAVGVGFKVSFLEISVPASIWRNHNIVTYKLQYLWCVWTSPVQGHKFYFLHWVWVVEWSRRKKSHWIPMGK